MLTKETSGWVKRRRSHFCNHGKNWQNHCRDWYRLLDYSISAWLLNGSMGSTTTTDFGNYQPFSGDGIGVYGSSTNMTLFNNTPVKNAGSDLSDPNSSVINNASGVSLASGTTTVGGTLTLTAGALGVGTNTLVINNGSSVGTGSLTSGATGTVNYGQSSNGAAGRRVIAMCLAKVGVQKGLERARPFGACGVDCRRVAISESPIERLGDQIIARLEMSVEATMG